MAVVSLLQGGDYVAGDCACSAHHLSPGFLGCILQRWVMRENRRYREKKLFRNHRINGVAVQEECHSISSILVSWIAYKVWVSPGLWYEHSLKENSICINIPMSLRTAIPMILRSWYRGLTTHLLKCVILMLIWLESTYLSLLYNLWGFFLLAYFKLFILSEYIYPVNCIIVYFHFSFVGFFLEFYKTCCFRVLNQILLFFVTF